MEAFELRLWDGRLGRWLSVDPYGQYHSPYLGMGNNPVNGIDPDGGWSSGGDCPDCPSPNGPFADLYEHRSIDGSTYIFDAINGKFSTLGEVTVIGGRYSPANISRINASIALIGYRTMQIEGFLIGNDISVIGFADDWLIPIVGAGATVGILYYSTQLPPTVKPTFAESVAMTGTISCTAGPAAYSPDPPKLMPNFNEIMASSVATAVTVHQMGKGGNQGQWDDELSPLSEEELLALLKEAIASGNKKLKQRIIKEQKRRGNRNKGKNRGRGDIK
jgi:hypothetical protein